MQHTSVLILLTLVAHVYSAPQFITFKDGRLGVNFAGYHAGVGIGGGAGNGAAGGLFAEAGTPHGQAARAGLGGSVGEGGTGGGLFAGATAGGNVRASAGLGGAVAGEKTAGSGFAAASAGAHESASGLVCDQCKAQRKEEKRRRKEQKKAQKAAAAALARPHYNGGESSSSGSSSFKFSGTKSFGVPSAVVQQTELASPQHNVQTEFKLDAANEIKHTENENVGNNYLAANAQTVDSVPQTVFDKTIIHAKHQPSHHQSAYIGGFIGGEAQAYPAQKRVDVVETSAHSDVGAGSAGSNHGINGQVSYKKEVAFEKNPNFFRDIFNIPISTLKAVSGLLSNTAANTNIKVEKTDSIQAESDIHPKHATQSQSSLSSDSQITVQTPNASKLFDDIFAIPINTLGAVNAFLENNVMGRKRIQVTKEVSGGEAEPTRARLGHHARRRANKRVIIVQETPEDKKE